MHVIGPAPNEKVEYIEFYSKLLDQKQTLFSKVW